MSLLFYRRPDYVEKAPGYLNNTDCQIYVDRTRNSKHKPPPELSFENILANRTLPPCTLGDFMDYLVYVAHDAENLQFYLWHRDYERRFAALGPQEYGLSPPWTFDDSLLDGTAPGLGADADANTRQGITFEKGTTFPSPPAPRAAAPPSPRPVSGLMSALDKGLYDKGFRDPRSADAHYATIAQPPAAGASDDEIRSFIERSISWQRHKAAMKPGPGYTNALSKTDSQGFTSQPFRAEINRIIAHYLAPGAPRELSLSPRTRAAILHALQHTTHPSAFAPAVALLTATLENQSHPNFIRWSICNGNRPRTFFVRTMGIISLVCGFVIAILLTLSRANRWWRLFALPWWFIGVATLVAAYKGLCIILHGTHTRNLKPWEDPAALYSTFTGADAGTDDEDALWACKGDARAPSDPGTALPPLRAADAASNDWAARNPASPSAKRSLDTFGSANESYASGDSWVERYRRKNIVRKIFDRSTEVQEGAVRVLQDRIARQGQLWGVIVTIPLCVLFVAVPKGNSY